MRRLIMFFGIAFGVCVVWATAAGADTSGNANTDEDGIEHGVSIRIDIPPRRGSPSTQRPLCAYSWMDYPPDATVNNLDGTPIAGDGTGQWFMLRCDDELIRVIYVRPGSPAQMADEAQRYLPLPLPQPRFAPPEQQIVNLASWLWIDDQAWWPLRSTVSIPGVSVSVTAEPERIEWATGDGTVVVCDGPGTPFDPAVPQQVPSCAYTYRRSSASQPEGAYAASVTVQWRATWTVQGAAGGGDLGFIARTSTITTRVGEVQALNTNRN